MLRRHPNLSHDRFARKFATFLSRSVPAEVAGLCLELKCTRRALIRAAETLADLGVSVSLSDSGWIADDITWPECRKLAEDYDDACEVRRTTRDRR